MITSDALRWARECLRPSSSASLDAQVLLGHVLHAPRASILARPEIPLSPAQDESYRSLVARRARGEPVAYLLGHREWLDLDLVVDRRVLVPRPETELLAELAIDMARALPARFVVDVGTGSGALAIALARALPLTHLVATDLSAQALEVARENVIRYGLEERVTLLHDDLLPRAADAPDLDLVVANLPYLSTRMITTLPADVQHEPVNALHGGETGLELYQRLLVQVVAECRPIPVLLEIDPRQEEAASTLMLTYFPGATVTVHPDLAGRPRVVTMVP